MNQSLAQYFQKEGLLPKFSITTNINFMCNYHYHTNLESTPWPCHNEAEYLVNIPNIPPFKEIHTYINSLFFNAFPIICCEVHKELVKKEFKLFCKRFRKNKGEK
jgi:hypothetical protein